MNSLFCPTCQNRIHNKARLCLHCLAARKPSRLRLIPPHPRMPALDSRLVAAWAYPFQLIEKAGGADLPRWRRLTWLELGVVFINPLALLLGPVYFVYLGMWKRALVLSATWLLMPAIWLLLVDHVVALHPHLPTPLSMQWLAVRPLAWLAIWMIAALVFAVNTNRDFYRKLEEQDVSSSFMW
ncbi:MAG: hypothetical protein EOO28_20430 [Comamonadaceae bacterium]|nr:MAG: hypothetical protein EOO28_20430 [Comamonadaceae bacterium]